jgi:peptidoglycan/xylan/chitin deacetylase (PgdA/CDA1 family)
LVSDIITLDKNIFKKQIEYLSKHHYKTVSLGEIGRMLREAKKIPSNWVVLTFDDGLQDFYSEAYPVIKEYGFKATIFVFMDRINEGNDGLSWDEIIQLQNDGLIEIGSHSISHRPLTLIPSSEAMREIRASKVILEERLKRPVIAFAYPWGALNNPIMAMVKSSGYQVAVGTAYRRGEFPERNPYILKRVFVSGLTGYPLVFRFMLSGYYVPTRELVLRILNIKTPRLAPIIF